MTIRAKNRAISAGAIVALIATAASVLPMLASSELDKRRDVHLVIRDMAFYVDGKGEPNPTLQFRRGERVRLILRNEDAGMDHDLVIKNWKIAMKVVHGRGEEVLKLKIPRRAGSASYYCTPHAAKMRGTILVE